MTRPIRTFVESWVRTTVGLASGPDVAESNALSAYEMSWDVILAMAPEDPNAYTTLRAMSAHLSRWEGYARPLDFPIVRAEQTALHGEAARLLPAEQAINFLPHVGLA